jgi:hypothetical protein
MILWFEEVEDMGPEGLVCFDDIGPCGVLFAGYGKGGGCLRYCDAGADECIDETGGSGEVGLVCGKDIAAGVPVDGISQYAVEEPCGDEVLAFPFTATGGFGGGGHGCGDGVGGAATSSCGVGALPAAAGSCGGS